jgi:FtsZ-binding cell division protein ZapB
MLTFGTLLIMVSFSPVVLHAENIVTGSKPAAVETTEITALKARINELKAMDKSALSRSEKRDMRNELKEVKKQLRENNNGIYLSVGAVIIIILLLILLL